MRLQHTPFIWVGNKNVNMTLIPVCQWLSPIYWYYPSFIAWIQIQYMLRRILFCKYIDFLLLRNTHYKELGNALSTYKSEVYSFSKYLLISVLGTDLVIKSQWPKAHRKHLQSRERKNGDINNKQSNFMVVYKKLIKAMKKVKELQHSERSYKCRKKRKNHQRKTEKTEACE